MNNGKYLEIPIFATGEKMKIAVKEILCEKKSPFQNIIIVDTEEFGKCLIIDNILQTAEKDHAIYDNELLKLLKNDDKKLLILGGGDGYVAEAALRKNKGLEIEIVDLDLDVVRSCQQELGQKVFDDPRTILYIADVFHHLGVALDKANKKFNGIVCDLTDAPIGRKEKKDFKDFYSKIIELAVENLDENGWISIQSGASKTTGEYIDAVGIISNILEKYFKDISRSDVFIPSYGESCAFLFGKKPILTNS